MANNTYKTRIADQILSERLEEVGAVLIEGPKWCGKTTTALQQARSAVMLANPETLQKSKVILIIITNFLSFVSLYNNGIRVSLFLVITPRLMIASLPASDVNSQ